MTFGQPQIPAGIMTPCVEIREGKQVYSADDGGQYLPGVKTRIPFQGAILPLNERDLRNLPQGTYTAETKKLYTNGHVLAVGSKVEWKETGIIYTVKGELEYGDIHQMRRYLVAAKRVAAT